jgi:hypothetical protein
MKGRWSRKEIRARKCGGPPPVIFFPPPSLDLDDNANDHDDQRKTSLRLSKALY